MPKASEIYLQRIRNNLLGFFVEVRVNESDVIIASDDVPQGRESLLDSLNLNLVRQGIPQMLEFLVCCGEWDDESVAVSN